MHRRQTPFAALREPEPEPKRPSAPPPRPVVRRRRHKRRRWPWVVIPLTLIVALLAAGGGLALWADSAARALEGDVASQFKLGQAQMEAGKAALAKASSDHDPAGITAAKADFAAASHHFALARARVDQDPNVHRASGLPYLKTYVDPRVHAVDELSAMGIEVADAATSAADVEALLVTPTKDDKTSSGARLLSLLDQTRPIVAVTRTHLAAAQAHAKAVDVAVLPAAQRGLVASSLATINKALTGLDEFDRLIPVLQEVLGANGPRTYLIEQANPFELRPGGGLVGSYSVIKADKGTVTVVKSGKSDALLDPRPVRGERGYVAPPSVMREFLGVNSWSLLDSNFFPDFPSNAQAAVNFASKGLNMKIDGVISMDLYVVNDLLGLTGPINVPGYGTIDSNNFIPTLIALGDFSHAGTPAKEFVGLVATPVTDKITTLPSNQWSPLVSVLNKNAATRHLQAWFANQLPQDEMGRIGWSGSLQPAADRDYLYESEANFGGTKANYFLQRTYTVELSVNGNTVHHHVVVHMVNKTPLRYPSEYRYYVRFLVPGDAQNVKIGGVLSDKYPPDPPPAGTKLADGWNQVNVSPVTGQGTNDTILDYDSPWRGDGSTLYWQKEPGTTGDKISVSLSIDGHTFKADGDLAQDRLLVLTSKGVTIQAGNQATAQLPGLSLG